MNQQDLNELTNAWHSDTNWLNEKIDEFFKAAQDNAYALGLARGLKESEAKHTTPQPAPAPLSNDTERLEWLLWKLPGDALRYLVGELADTSSGAEFRAAIDAAIAAQGGK